jgi:hypothetical protein
MPPPRDDSPYRLIVEGPDDQWSIINLLRRHGYDWDDSRILRPFVQAAGGIDELLRPAGLSAAIKTCAKLGIVIDADLSASDRWSRTRTLFKQLGIPIPPIPDPAGVLVEHGKDGGKTLGIWMMPDNANPGILENFIAKLIPVDDGVREHADSSTRTACDLGAPLAHKDHMKGMVHAWLAWQNDPGMPFGSALNAKVLRHDSKEALAFVAWFQRLFATGALHSQRELSPTGSSAQ